MIILDYLRVTVSIRPAGGRRRAGGRTNVRTNGRTDGRASFDPKNKTAPHGYIRRKDDSHIAQIFASQDCEYLCTHVIHSAAFLFASLVRKNVNLDCIPG